MSYEEAIKIIVCVEYDGGTPAETAQYEAAKQRIFAQRKAWRDWKNP